jgi:hypothetical protein
MDYFDSNPLDEVLADADLKGFASAKPPGQKISVNSIEARALRQKPYFTLLTQFQTLFYDIPDLTAKDVDDRVKVMYDTLMEVCESVGISRISIPQLKECCGKRRVWKEELKGLRIGDKLAWLFDKMGIRKCAGCKKRQEALNKIRLPGS